MILEGYHDGYARLKKPVKHRRTVLFFGGRHFLIRDTFSGVGIHDFELNYHLHPEATSAVEQTVGGLLHAWRSGVYPASGRRGF